MSSAEFASRLARLRQDWADGATGRGELFCLLQDEPLHFAAGALDSLLTLADGQPQRAFELAAQAVKTDRGLGIGWYALARAYVALGQLLDARAALNQALACDRHDGAAWMLLGETLAAMGVLDDAAIAFSHACEECPAALRPRLDLASVMLARGDLGPAEATARAAVASHPDRAEPHFVLGNVLEVRGRPADAAEAYRRATVAKPGWAEAQHNLAMALTASRDLQGALAAGAAAIELAPDNGQVIAEHLHLRRLLADWREVPSLSQRLRAAVLADQRQITPFSLLAEPVGTAEQVRAAAQWIADLPRRPAPPHRAAGAQPLRIGFLSCGFGNHPTAVLISEFVERLRGGPLRTIAFATRPDDGGALRQRMKRAFDEWHELHRGRPEPAADLVRRAELDVLIDLDGYIEFSWPELMALRPAPLQVGWLGYPGPTAAPFIDYLLVDKFVISADERRHYTEKLLRLPDSYQPNDGTRRLVTPPPRKDCGLPERGTVYASFNQTWKITPDVFGCWMEILRAVPDSVLWLLAPEAGALAIANLRATAAAAGIEPQRLILQDKLTHEQYLARYRHADLFLDTWPYNAHTTASDALFAGCPLLTLPGATFASRVAGSLLSVLGLPELIAKNTSDYIASAVAIGKSVKARTHIRHRVAERRKASGLFDSGRFARNFERAMRIIVERQRAGFGPDDIDL